MDEAELNSQNLAHFIQATDGISKPWLLAQLRLQKLREQQADLTPEAYMAAIADLHQDVMNLGEWWVGLEDEVF